MIYLDNAATTKPNQNAFDKAKTFLFDNFYNPSSSYTQAFNVKKALDDARKNLISHIGNIDEYNLIFTSGGSESNNIAAFCTSNRGNFVTSKGEHSATHNAFLELKNRGNEVRFADLNSDSSINLDSLYKLIDKKTTLVSVVHINNETGAINDINKIARKIKAINKDVLFHCDGVQSFGKLPFKMSNDIDLFSASSHKIGGLKGTGFLLYHKKVYLRPFIFGGGQENKLRSGTENVLGIKMFEYAAQEKYSQIKANYKKVCKINTLFRENLDSDIFTFLSPLQNTSPYILAVSAIGLKGQVLQTVLSDNGILCGTGSACSSKNPHSRILQNCGLSCKILDGVLRFSFDNSLTVDKAFDTIDIINKTAKTLINKIS